MKRQFAVKGLATAATLWISTAVGLACGSGFVLEAMIFTAVTIFILLVFGRLLDYIDNKAPSVTVCCEPGVPISERVRSLCNKNGLELKMIKILSSDDSGIRARVFFANRAVRVGGLFCFDNYDGRPRDLCGS